MANGSSSNITQNTEFVWSFATLQGSHLNFLLKALKLHWIALFSNISVEMFRFSISSILETCFQSSHISAMGIAIRNDPQKNVKRPI